MCIRDSLGAPMLMMAQPYFAAPPGAVPNCGPVDLFYTWVSVSYTHLRAHETVLDLVCRLLLEKKKLSNHIIHI